MFETLNDEALSELAKVGDRTLMKESTRIDDLSACLQQAITECSQPEACLDRSFNHQQVVAGLHAAQQILLAWWQSEGRA